MPDPDQKFDMPIITKAQILELGYIHVSDSPRDMDGILMSGDYSVYRKPHPKGGNTELTFDHKTFEIGIGRDSCVINILVNKDLLGNVTTAIESTIPYGTTHYHN